MLTYDFSPLYRSFVGFDRMANLIDAATQAQNTNSSYPPYNVAQISEDEYRIELAVAGFSDADLEIESHQNVLTVTGTKAPKTDDEANDNQLKYMHRGIAERGFERRFQLADHVFVQGAKLENGLLVIALKRELPEALKPRKIAIGQADEKLIIQKSSRKGKAA